MHAKDVPEAQARQMRCPSCAARRDYPCQSSSLRAGRNRALKRAHVGRRKAWLARNESEEINE